VARGERTDVSALEGSRGRRRGRPRRPPGSASVGQAGLRRPGGGGGAALSRALSGLHGQAFPRASGEGPRLRLGLHRAEAASALGGAGVQGGAKGGASAQARAAAAARHDAAWRARGTPASRTSRPLISLSRSMRRRGDLFGVSGRPGGHGLDLPGAEGGLLRARPADEPLHRSRGALFSPPKAGGEIDRGDPTQVCRALEQFGVEDIGPIRRIARRETGVLPGARCCEAVRSARSGRCRIVSARNSGMPA
jgi:hypothetical protein